MTNYEKTLDICENYLRSGKNNVIKVYNEEKRSEKSRFLYIYEEAGLRIIADLLVDEKTNHVVLDAHASVKGKWEKTITACKILCEYCQMHSSAEEPGFLYYSDHLGRVRYHISTPFIDSPISEYTVGWMNFCAWRKLHKNDSNLALLPNCHSQETVQTCGSENTADGIRFPKNNLYKTLINLRIQLSNNRRYELDCIMKCKVAKLSSDEIESGSLFISRELWVNSTGCVIVVLKSKYKIPEDNREPLVMLINEINSMHKVTGLRTMTIDGCLWISAAISLWDGPVSWGAIEYVVSILLSGLSRNRDDFIKCACVPIEMKTDNFGTRRFDYSMYRKDGSADNPVEQNPFFSLGEREIGDSLTPLYVDLFGHQTVEEDYDIRR